jgi:UDP-3-O-[3-hydroxymyristoyl] glucosamine N-acyltransferase
VSINRSLYVLNRSLFSSDVSINGFTKLNNSVSINKDISSSFALDVSGITVLRGPLYTLSDVSLGQKLFVSGDASFNQNLSVGQDVSINRSLYVQQRALFNGDVSVNQNLQVLGKGSFGQPPSSTLYELDVSGQMRIYEAVGSNVTTSSSVGTLTLQHGDASGCSSIMFTSPSTTSNGDYAYIKYQDLSGTTTTNAGLLTIGIENDTTDVGIRDRISLYAAGGSGFVGVNTLDPSFNLDVSGNTNIRNTLFTNNIEPSSATSALNIASTQTSGIINIGVNTATARRGAINLGTGGQSGHSTALNWGTSSNSGQLDFKGGTFNFASTGNLTFNSSYGPLTANIITGARNGGVFNLGTGDPSGTPTNAFSGNATNNSLLNIATGSRTAGSDINIASNTSSAEILNIGTGADRTGPINIGTGNTGTKTIGIGGSLTTTNVVGLSVTFASDVSLNGNTRLGTGSNSIAINKDISSNFALDVSGITMMRATLYTLSDVSLGQKLFVFGDVSVNQNLFIGQDVSINRSLYVNNNSLLNGDVSVNQNLFIGQDLSVNRFLYINNNSVFNGDASFNQNLFIGQDVSINRSLYVNNNSLFNGDVSTNQNLYVSGKASFGRPPANTTYEVDVSGQMRIYEAIGSDVTTSSSVGTLTLEHGDASGCSSIMFKSPSTTSNGDYAYIKYQDLSGATTNAGLLTIGIENDTTAAATRDRISLYAAGGLGYVGINTLNPQFSLDVTGNIRATGNIITNTYNGGNPTTNVSLFTTTTANISIGGATGSSNLIAIGTSASLGNVRIGGNIKLGYGTTYVGVNKDISNGFLFDVSGDSMFRDKLFVNSDASFGTNVNVVGDVSVNQSLYVRNRSLFSNDVSINGFTQHNNSVAINKDISSEYALDVSGLTNLRGNLTTTNITTNGSLSITGGGSLTVNGLPVSGASVGTALTTQGVQVGNDTNYFVTIDKPNFYNDPSLVIYYNFDTSFNNGTQVRNMANPGTYDGSLNGFTGSTPGMINTSVFKYGTASLKNNDLSDNQGVQLLNSPVSVSSTMSFSLWVNFTSSPNPYYRVFELTDHTAAAQSLENNTIALDISGNGVVYPVLTHATTSNCFATTLTSPVVPYNLQNTGWNHITWLITPTRSSIYVNGSIKQVDVISTAVPNVTRANGALAFSYLNSREYNGFIDEFRYYKDKTLNQAEIFQLYRNTFYNLDICGGFLANGSSVIYEPVGSKAGPNSGSLTLIHGDASGSSSIMFKSVNDPSEYGYIQYEENSAGSTGVHYGLMTIGIENDTGAVTTQADRISLFPSGGQGFVGVNTKTPQTTLDVSGTLNVSGTAVVGSYCKIYSNGNDAYVQNTNTLGILYLQSNVSATGTTSKGIMINKDGNVGIKVTPSASYALDVSGNVEATSYNATSDYRIKKNLVPLDLTFNVDLLNPVSYYLKHDKDARLNIGFIAHEVQEVYPFLVNGVKDGSFNQSINYNGFIGILTKEIQVLKKKVSDQALEHEAKALEQEARISNQEERLQALEKMLLNK